MRGMKRSLNLFEHWIQSVGPALAPRRGVRKQTPYNQALTQCRVGLLLVLLAFLGVLPVRAVLGEKLSDISKRYGRPEPQPKGNKNAATWLLEGEDGQLIYTATFDAKGRSIGEGMKPVRYAKFTDQTIQKFVEMQLAPFRNSKTLRTAKPGEKYSFGGKIYSAGREETVIVDDANDLLIVLTKGALPSVMAVTHVMMD